MAEPHGVRPYDKGLLLQIPGSDGTWYDDYSGLILHREVEADVPANGYLMAPGADAAKARTYTYNVADGQYFQLLGVCLGRVEYGLVNPYAVPQAGDTAAIAIPVCTCKVVLQEAQVAGTILAPGQSQHGTVTAWVQDDAYLGVLLEGGEAGDAVDAYVVPIERTVPIDVGPIGQYAFTALDGQPNPSMLWQGENLMSGLTDSLRGIVSIWFHFDTFPDSDEFLLKVSTTNNFNKRVQIGATNDDGVRLVLRSSTGTTLLEIETAVYPATEGWYHLLASWDLSGGNTFEGNVHLYLNDIDIKPVAATAFVTGTPVDWDHGGSISWRYSINGGLVGQGQAVSCIGPYYVAIGQYLDFSLEANRRKYITPAKRPAALGIQGEFPTGVSPTLYFNNPLATYHENRGTAGDFLHDDLLTCADPPGTGSLGPVI